jgi:hypothetical protein
MADFPDCQGRRWRLQVNARTLTRVREELSIDLVGGGDDAVCAQLAALCNDSQMLVSVLYCLCAEQAEKRGVSPEDFGRSLAGETDRGASALGNTLVRNLKSPAARKALLRGIRENKRV